MAYKLICDTIEYQLDGIPKVVLTFTSGKTPDQLQDEIVMSMSAKVKKIKYDDAESEHIVIRIKEV